MATQLVIVCVCLALYYMFFVVARNGEQAEGNTDEDGAEPR